MKTTSRHLLIATLAVLVYPSASALAQQNSPTTWDHGVDAAVSRNRFENFRQNFLPRSPQKTEPVRIPTFNQEAHTGPTFGFDGTQSWPQRGGVVSEQVGAHSNDQTIYPNGQRVTKPPFASAEGEAASASVLSTTRFNNGNSSQGHNPQRAHEPVESTERAVSEHGEEIVSENATLTPFRHRNGLQSKQATTPPSHSVEITRPTNERDAKTVRTKVDPIAEALAPVTANPAKHQNANARGLWFLLPLILLPLLGWFVLDALLSSRRQRRRASQSKPRVFERADNAESSVSEPSAHDGFRHTENRRFEVRPAAQPVDSIKPSYENQEANKTAATSGEDLGQFDGVSVSDTSPTVDFENTSDATAVNYSGAPCPQRTQCVEVTTDAEGTFDTEDYSTQSIASDGSSSQDRQEPNDQDTSPQACGFEHDVEKETSSSTSTTSSDLLRIAGLGQTGVKLLNDHGIYSFEQLRDTAAARLSKILNEAGPQFRLTDPRHYLQQAEFAAKGDWTGLDKWQKENPTQCSPRSIVVNREPAGYDNLTKIRGIGPATAKVLNANGIHCFAQIAGMSSSQLESIIAKAGSRLRLVDPTSWPRQAKAAMLQAGYEQENSKDEESLASELFNDVEEIRAVLDNHEALNEAPAYSQPHHA